MPENAITSFREFFRVIEPNKYHRHKLMIRWTNVNDGEVGGLIGFLFILFYHLYAEFISGCGTVSLKSRKLNFPSSRIVSVKHGGVTLYQRDCGYTAEIWK